MQHHIPMPSVQNHLIGSQLTPTSSCPKFSGIKDSNQQKLPFPSVPMYPFSVDIFLQAAISDDIKTIEHYIQTIKIPVDVTDKSGNTALLFASRNGHVNVVRRLIEFGAQVDYQEPKKGYTALHCAAQCGHTRTAEALVHFGNANPLIRNVEGKTPYDVACSFGHGNNKIMKSLFIDGTKSPDSMSVITNSSRYSSNSSLNEIHVDANNNNHHSTFNHNRDHNHNHHSHQHNRDHSRTNNGGNLNKISSKKNVTYLPNTELLEHFYKFGCFRLVGDGFGYELLAKNGPVTEMIFEAAKKLGLEPINLDGLLESLIHIVQQFQQIDPILRKEYEIIEETKLDDQQRMANLDAYKKWRQLNSAIILNMIKQLFEWQRMICMQNIIQDQQQQQKQPLEQKSQ